MAIIWEKGISILAGNLNLGRGYDLFGQWLGSIWEWDQIENAFWDYLIFT